MDGDALYLAATMLRTVHLREGDVVLDLSCERGATCKFLARHRGVRVVALDLWITASEPSREFT